METVSFKLDASSNIFQKLQFIEKTHPNQPSQLNNVPWVLHRVYNRVDGNGKIVPRN